MMSPSKFYWFTLAEIVLCQSAQFGFLDMSTGNTSQQVGLAISVYFGVRTMPEL